MYPPRYIAPPPSNPLEAIRTVGRIIALVVGLPALAVVVYVIVGFEREKKRDLVVFDNHLDTPAQVVVDGKVIETVKPRSTWNHPVVQLPEGAKKIVVTSNGTTVSEVALAIRPRAKNEEHGYRGLYVIGPPTDYVIAKVPYYSETPKTAERPSLTPLPRPGPLTELPRELESFEMNIDEPFLESESMPEGTKMVWKTHLCTIDRTKASRPLGCSGFPSFSSR